MNHLLDKIKQHQYELIKDYLPADVDKNDNLKIELINLLKKNQTQQRKIDFLGQLHAFSQAKAAFPTISIDKIGYQQKRLSVDVSNNRLNEIEALLAILETSVPGSRLENLNIKPDVISGRYILDGNQDG